MVRWVLESYQNPEERNLLQTQQGADTRVHYAVAILCSQAAIANYAVGLLQAQQLFENE